MLNESITEKLQTFFDSYTTTELVSSYRILHTPSEFAKDNLCYIQEAGYLKSLKSHINKREQLNSYLFLIVLSGSGQFTYKDKIHDLRAGDCIFINCNHPYSHQSREEDPWELMWVHFNGKNVDPYHTFYENLNPEVVSHVNSSSEASAMIEACLEAEKKNDILSEFVQSKMIIDLMTLCMISNGENMANSSIKKMHLIKEYIDQNYKNKISLSEIAKEFYLSKYYLAREFKKVNGVTIGDYINVKRITYSKELLRFTNQTIEEISAKCGIPDTNYFAKLFKRLEDCSPSAYRKKW